MGKRRRTNPTRWWCWRSSEGRSDDGRSRSRNDRFFVVAAVVAGLVELHLQDTVLIADVPTDIDDVLAELLVFIVVKLQGRPPSQSSSWHDGPEQRSRSRRAG